MRAHVPTILTLAAFVGVVLAAGARFADRARAPGAIAAGTNGADAHPPDGTADAGPTRENVSQQFRAEVETLRLQLKDAPRDSALLIALARLLQSAHQPAEAASYYRRYLARTPMDRQAWLDLASVYAAMGQWEQAKAATLSLLESFPNDPAAMYNLGAINANAGNYQEAARWWTRLRDARTDEALAAKAAESLRRMSSRGT